MDSIGTTLTFLQIMIQALIMTFATTMVIQHQPRTTLTERLQAGLLQRRATMELASQAQHPKPRLLVFNSFHAVRQMFENRTHWATSANQLTYIPTRGAQAITGKPSLGRAR